MTGEWVEPGGPAASPTEDACTPQRHGKVQRVHRVRVSAAGGVEVEISGGGSVPSDTYNLRSQPQPQQAGMSGGSVAWQSRKRSATDAVKERLLQPQRMPPAAPAASPTVVTVASQQQPAAARSSSANRSSAPSSPQPPPLRRLQIAWRPISSLQGITHVACRGVYIYRIQYIHPSSPAVYNLVLPLVTMAAHIPREYPRTLSWTAGGCACAIRESHRTLKLTLAISTLCSHSTFPRACAPK